MKDLLFFNDMITPKIITVVYWLLLLMVVISGLGSMFAMGFSFGSFLKGLFMIVVGGIGVRIWSELMIVLFKINENMQKLADKS
ncbi:MAG: DUF4282 domain-containing protein [Halothiobacillus sp.]